MFSWSPKHQDGLISIPQDKLVALVMDSPCIVRVLTDDFSTLLECVCKIDKNKDGKIVFRRAQAAAVARSPRGGGDLRNAGPV